LFVERQKLIEQFQVEIQGICIPAEHLRLIAVIGEGELTNRPKTCRQKKCVLENILNVIGIATVVMSIKSYIMCIDCMESVELH